MEGEGLLRMEEEEEEGSGWWTRKVERHFMTVRQKIRCYYRRLNPVSTLIYYFCCLAFSNPSDLASMLVIPF